MKTMTRTAKGSIFTKNGLISKKGYLTRNELILELLEVFSDGVTSVMVALRMALLFGIFIVKGVRRIKA